MNQDINNTILINKINELERELSALKAMDATVILESINEAFFSLDNNLVVTYFNQAAEKILGKKREEVMGRYLFDAFPEAKNTIFDEKYTQAVKEKISLRFECFFDVEPYKNWYDVRVFGHDKGISVFFLVTTKEKLIEQQLREFIERLEAQNEEYQVLIEELNEKNDEYASLNEEYTTANEELSEALEKLNESETKYGDIVEMAMDMICIANLKTNHLIQVNTSFTKILGYTKEELISRSFMEFIHPDDVQMTKDIVEYNLKEGKKVIQFTNRYKCKDGSYRWLSWNSNPLVEKGLIYAVARDVNSIIEKEVELHNRNEFIRTVLDNLPIGVALNKITEGTAFYMNKKFKEIYGWDEEDITDINTFFEKVYPDKAYRELLMKKVMDDITSGDSSRMHWEGLRVTKKNKSTGIINAVNIPFFEQNTMVSTVIDVTEQALAEEKLRLNEFRLSSLVELNNMKDKEAGELYDFVLERGVSLSNSKIGFLGFVNEEETIVTIHSWSKDAMNECSVSNRYIEFNIDESGIWAECIRRRKSFVLNDYRKENPLKKGVPEGHTEIWNYASVPVFDRGKIVAVIAVANKDEDYNQTDITQLTLLMDGMWKIISQKRYEAELIEAKELAQEGEKVKAAFLANMSHEIRTPMNGIIGFSDMLIKENIDEDKRKQFASIIINCGNQLLSIVDDILDLSIIDSGRMILVNSDFVVNELVADVYNTFQQETIHKRIQFITEKRLPDNESILYSDKLRIRQVLNNLVNNAFKFTITGHVKIGYRVDVEFFTFYVEDTGIGIEPSMHQKIFERFRQADLELTRQYGGTGLGLSISLQLVHLLGGRIWVESELNKGSVFYFTIPRKENPERILANNTHVDMEKKGKLDFDFKDRKITLLVAEDEDVNMLFFREILSSFNIEIIHARDGEEAIRLLNEHDDVDLILMDIKMPVLNGIDATIIIKKTHPTLPVIAQTAFALSDDMDRIKMAGFDGYITKPIIKRELFSIINKFLKNEK